MSDRMGGPERDAEQVPPAAVPGLNGMVTLLTALAVVAALYLGRQVLIPITLAVLLSFLLGPLVHRLRSWHLGRVPSVLMAVALGIVMIVGIAMLIGTQIADLVGHVSEYYGTIEQKIESVQDATLAPVTRFVNSLSVNHLSPAHPAHHAAAATQAPASGPAPPKPVPVEIQHHTTAVELAESVLTPVVSPLTDAFVVFIVAVFILLQREDLRDRLIRLFGSNDLHRTTVAMDEAGRRLSRYFLAQLSVNASFGCIIGVGLALIGVPSPVLWGLMAMLLRFVPYIGTPLAAILPVAVAAAVEPGWSMAIWTVALYFVVESITGQVVEPVLYGHSTGLSPAAVVIAAIFWTWIWGPIGLILSTPMTLCLVVLGRHVPRLEFLDVLLGDRPALTEVESFYQRLLAGDTDEVQEQAEDFLRDHSLTDYYDQVALPGLQLAASDARKGTLPADRVRALRRTVDALVQELDDHADAPLRDRHAHRRIPVLDFDLTGGWESNMPILCVAGRGALDGAAAAILAQLLGKHGLRARVASNAEVSRDAVMDLPSEGVAMVCVAYLELSGAPVHLRNLVRRLRHRFPDQPLLVGLYERGDPVLNERRGNRGGADLVVSSFHEAVQACIDTAREASQPPRAALSGQTV
jgi:predicted PurR-regulated permease PerM